MMNEFMDTDTEPIDQLKSEAQRALQERPLFSVRSVISLGFALWFILSLGITIASIVILTKIEGKLSFMESAAKYIFEVQQARRFEKNYFLYGTNLDDSLEQVRLADHILEQNSEKMVAVVGKQSFEGMVNHINLYE
jgi:two-component system NtrC family sensor kinase